MVTKKVADPVAPVRDDSPLGSRLNADQQAARFLLAETDSSHGPYYSGTKAQLMAAGLGTDCDFPGDGCDNYASKAVVRNGERLFIIVRTRRQTPFLYRVFVKAPANVSPIDRLKQASSTSDERTKAGGGGSQPKRAPTRAVRDLSIPLPDYILERNAQAKAAGLTVEKQAFRNDGLLTTWYRGTEQQWRASPFCRRTKPFVSQTGHADFHCYSLLSGHCRGLRVRGGNGFIEVRGKGADDYRGVIHESIPEWSEDIGDGIVAHGLESDSLIAYIGPLEAMRSRGIVPLDEERNGSFHSPSDDCYRFPDGRALYIDCVSARAGAARHEAEEKRIDAKSPDEWLENLATFARNIFYGFVLAKLATPVETKHGKLFSPDRGTQREILDAVDDLVELIRSTAVSVTDVGPDHNRVAFARRDKSFAAFLTTSGVPQSEGRALP